MISSQLGQRTWVEWRQVNPVTSRRPQGFKGNRQAERNESVCSMRETVTRRNAEVSRGAEVSNHRDRSNPRAVLRFAERPDRDGRQNELTQKRRTCPSGGECSVPFSTVGQPSDSRRVPLSSKSAVRVQRYAPNIQLIEAASFDQRAMIARRFRHRQRSARRDGLALFRDSAHRALE